MPRPNPLERVSNPSIPPLPPLKRGENLIKVPLFKGDLGGSKLDGEGRKHVLVPFLNREWGTRVLLPSPRREGVNLYLTWMRAAIANDLGSCGYQVLNIST